MSDSCKICKRVVDCYPHVLEYVPDCYMTQEMCKKLVDTYLSRKRKRCVKKLLIPVFLFFK